MTSKELLTMLNQAIASELHVSIEYMWEHVLWKGVHGFAVQEELKKIAIVEMSHAEKIAERLNYLGEVPTAQPDPIVLGKTLKEMVEENIKDETATIELYKKIITKAFAEQDNTTGFLFSQILQDEEEHHDFFTSLVTADESL